MLTTVKKRLAIIANTARRFPFSTLRRRYRRDADVVFWLNRRYPDPWWSYLLRGDSLLNDAALLNAILEAGHTVRIVVGPSIGAVTNSTIVYSIDAYNPGRVVNYSAGLIATLRELEAQGNTLCPSVAEAEFWENKVHMHRRFEEAGVNSPPTIAIDAHSDLDATLAGAPFGFPLLVKEPHSNNSKGVHKVDDRAALDALRRELGAQGSHELLLQGLIDMRRDLRVTMIGGEAVHHYWRINQSEEWMPTTTRKGSRVDFVTFPERWRPTIEAAITSLGLRNGAFDICWEGDDTDGEPIFLEVSPAYSPNPAPPAAFADRPYSDFKAQLTGPDSFPRAFVDLVFSLHRTTVAAWADSLPKR